MTREHEALAGDTQAGSLCSRFMGSGLVPKPCLGAVKCVSKLKAGPRSFS
jgi:hypothetical protein